MRMPQRPSIYNTTCTCAAPFTVFIQHTLSFIDANFQCCGFQILQRFRE